MFDYKIRTVDYQQFIYVCCQGYQVPFYEQSVFKFSSNMLYWFSRIAANPLLGDFFVVLWRRVTLNEESVEKVVVKLKFGQAIKRNGEKVDEEIFSLLE